MNEPKHRGRPAKAAAEVFDDKFGEAVQRAAGLKPEESGHGGRENTQGRTLMAQESLTVGIADAAQDGASPSSPTKIADVAQPEEQQIRNLPVAGSTPAISPEIPAEPRSADGIGEYALSMTKPRLDEAVEHLEAILMLIQGFNGNHELIKGWCRECDGNYLHGQESCLCPCHPARDFLVAVKKELAQPRL